MAAAPTRQTRRGASVQCSDGQAGTVVGIDNDAAGRPQYLRVAPVAGGEHLRVPLSVIQGVRDDGTVVLRCTRRDLGNWSSKAVATPATSGEARQEGAEPLGTIRLHEERLVPHRELRTVGEVEVRTELEEFPGRLEVDALREEVEVEHVPVGEVVKERMAPWEEDGVLVVPVYEEQLVVVKRLVMREQLRIRRVESSERRLFEQTLRRERVVVDDPGQTGLVHEQFAEAQTQEIPPADGAGTAGEGGFLDQLRRRLG